MKTTATILLVFGFLLSGGPASAAKDCTDSPIALVILDRSGSMGSQGSVSAIKSKWQIAKEAVDSMTTNFSHALMFGLSLFPKPSGGSCTAGVVEVQPAINSNPTIMTKLASTGPGGSTPIGSTLSGLLPWLQTSKQQTGKEHYVILITDGTETCSGDPIAAATAIGQAGIDLYVIGFGTGVNPHGAQANGGGRQHGRLLPSR
jgi:Ca-activated chloride channel family protein